MKIPYRFIITMALISILMGCSSSPAMKTVAYVDIDRFMGDWYVIANIPTFIEKNAFNAVENYRLNDDGTVATTFTFREGGFDGELKTYKPTGYIQNTETNAQWGMQFIWPIKSDYKIVYLDSNYQNTIIGRQARDYVWIMSRNPHISDEAFNRLRDYVAALGYDISELQKVPQRWKPSSTGEAS